MRTRTMRARALPLRADASRRIRRLSQRLYCRTNGCTTYLEVDRARGIAVCPVCRDWRPLDGPPGMVRGRRPLSGALAELA